MKLLKSYNITKMTEPIVQEEAQKTPQTGTDSPEQTESATPEAPKGDGGKEYTDAEKAAFARFQKEKDKANEAMERLAALEKEKAESEEQKAIAEGRLQDVIDKLKADNAELSTYKEKVDYSGEVINRYLEKEMEAIPEEMRSLVPDSLSPEDKLKYISDNSHILTKTNQEPVVPTATGGGNLPKNNSEPVLEEEEAMKNRYNELLDLRRTDMHFTSDLEKELIKLGSKLKELRAKQ